MGKRLAFFRDKTLQSWAPLDGTSEIRLPPFESLGFLTALALRPGANQIALGMYSGVVVVWDTQTGVAKHYETPGEYPTQVAFDGHRRIFVAFRGGSIAEFDTENQKEIDPRFIGSGDTVKALSISPDGTQLVAAADNEVTVWAIARRRPLVTLSNDRAATSLDWSQDRRHIAVGYRHGAVRIFRLPN